jgi:hypothetical protein
MKKTSNSPSIINNDELNKKLTTPAKVHANVEQEIIVTTEDKIRLCLMKHLSKVEKKGMWIAPAGILMTLIITFITADFKVFLFPAATWAAVFIMSTLLTVIWLLYSIRFIFTSTNMDDIINELKKASPIQPENEQDALYIKSMSIEPRGFDGVIYNPKGKQILIESKRKKSN